jgi:GH43 family beta-xylosidase
MAGRRGNFDYNVVVTLGDFTQLLARYQRRGRSFDERPRPFLICPCRQTSYPPVKSNDRGQERMRTPQGKRSSQPARYAEPLERRVLLSGLTGQYFDRVDFTDLKLTRVDSTVAFNWGTAAPDASMGSDNFSVRWTGLVQPQFSQDYTFYANSDDGVRLWVDGRLIIDNWVNHAVQEHSATLPLTAGRNYDIRLDYYDAVSTAQATLSWSSASVTKQTIPAARLFPSPAGLAATFYDNQDFTGGVPVTRTDAAVDFNWGSGAPATGIAPTTYSATWTGQILPQYSQTYTFSVTADAGAAAKLWVDRELVFDTSSIQPMAQVKLEAGKRYDIELSYAHFLGATANVKLEWSSPSQPKQVIPTSRLTASKLGGIPTRVPTYTNPVIDLNRADPGVLFSDGYYWKTYTTGGPNNGWPLYRSPDLLTWTSMGNMLTTANKPAFMDDGSFWAPEIHKVNGTYVITGTARSTQYQSRTTIAIATASEVTGPYTVRSTPIVGEQTVGTLDSTIFQDWDGRIYLLWKRQSNSATAANGSIRMRELDPANLTQFIAGSSETVLLNNAGGGAWENGIEEAPEMIHRGGYYYLFYSGSTINTTYALGVARATSLTGTYTRYPGNVPILKSNATWGGPGHGAFVQDVDGTWWHFYHARHQDNPNFGRVPMLDKVVWTADGWPTFAGATPSTTPQASARVDAASGAGRLTVAGDAGGAAADDVITVVRNAADASVLNVIVNGVTKISAPFDEIENLTLTGGGGNDTLLLDYSRGDASPGAGVTFAGATGNDVVRIVGAAAADEFRLFAGRLTHGTGLVTHTGIDKIVVERGTFRLDANLTSMPFEANGVDTSIVAAAGPQFLGPTTLNGALARFASTTGMTLVVSSLAITSGGRLDLAGNALIVRDGNVAGVRTQIAAGFNNGAWNGAGGIASSAAAADANALTAIGYASNASLNRTSFAGVTGLTPTDVLVKYTYYGDADLSGAVTLDDFTLFFGGYQTLKTTWIAGDFDYRGIVTLDDFTLFLAGYQQQGPPL